MRERDTRLSNDERLKLQEIESNLALEDPVLDRCMRSLTITLLTGSTEPPSVARPVLTLRVVFIVLMATAAMLMTAGVLLVVPLLSMGGVVLLSGGLVLRSLPRYHGS